MSLVTQVDPIALQPSGSGSRCESPEAITKEACQREHHSQGEELQRDGSPCGIDELREEGEEEDCSLGVENLDQNTFSVNATQRCWPDVIHLISRDGFLT